MTTSSTLRGAWSALQLEPEQLPGLYRRRVFALSGFEVFAGLIRPGGQLRLIVEVPAVVGTDGLERETKGFRVLRHDLANGEGTRLSMELASVSFRELFEVMAEDVSGRILSAPNESEAVARMRERLDHWERFMSAAGPGGLSAEKQVGLFGELTFLKTLLTAGVPGTQAVGMWLGPTGANQDFKASDRAIEVKTTTSNSATTIRIANELQLDDTDCQQLHLMHLWLRSVDGGGVSLPSLAEGIAAQLTGGIRQDFTDRLAAAGYHEVHRSLYDKAGYSERRRRYYRIEGGFPRLSRGDLPSGVSKVEYDIDLAGCDGYARDELAVIASLAGTGG